ncbi:helix-turn-helix domain-containing protein [Candidatus Poriferisodalis sp.]|uniref:helix-turn-helix domain-containing protein n=1 Tax=Candidatus Poriferisodalis sp. TaxID=3101277 RepID=UPI003AF80140
MTAAQRERQFKKQRVVECVRAGSTVTAAAQAAGVSVSTVARWRQADPMLYRQVASALADRDFGSRACRGPSAASFDAMSWLEAVQFIEEFLQQAEEAGELDVDLSDMDGPLG